MRLLAIDFGRKRVGIAVTDESRLVITPLEQILFTNQSFWEKLSDLISRYSPIKIILGYPDFPIDSLEKSQNKRSDKKNHLLIQISEFKKALQKRFPLSEIVLVNEAYSSQEAEEIWQKKYPKKKFPHRGSKQKKKKVMDSYAAGVILNRYLNLSAF